MSSSDLSQPSEVGKAPTGLPPFSVIVVSTNLQGDLVIRQQREDRASDDPVIIVPRSLVGSFIKQVQTEFALQHGGPEATL